MCWITLTPNKNKAKRTSTSTSSDCSSASIVRVHHSTKPRFSDVTVSLPSTTSTSSSPKAPSHHHHHDRLHLPEHLLHHAHLHAPLPHGLLNHHHRHPHLHPIHPLHLHPPAPLRGAGKKIVVEKPCPPHPHPPSHQHRPPPPPPSSSSSSSTTSTTSCPPAREPTYRIQIVEPSAVRATTRSALHDVRERGRVGGRVGGRMRRVGGYEVLGRQVPWDWDCVSSTVGSSIVQGPTSTKKKGKKRGGLKYPPFGRVERWM